MSFSGIELIEIVLLVCADKDLTLLLGVDVITGVIATGVCVVSVSSVLVSAVVSHLQTIGGSNQRTDFGKSTVNNASFSRFASIVFISASISSGRRRTPGTGGGGGL